MAVDTTSAPPPPAPQPGKRQRQRTKANGGGSGAPTAASMEDLGIPQTQLFDIFQQQRHSILAALTGEGGVVAGEREGKAVAGEGEAVAGEGHVTAEAMRETVLGAVARVVTFTGTRTPPPGAVELRGWEHIDGERNSGRFVVRASAPGTGRYGRVARTPSRLRHSTVQRSSTASSKYRSRHILCTYSSQLFGATGETDHTLLGSFPTDPPA